MPRHEVKAIALRERRNNQVRFDQGKVVPMHCRGPAPNGRYTNFGLSTVRSGQIGSSNLGFRSGFGLHVRVTGHTDGQTAASGLLRLPAAWPRKQQWLEKTLAL